jgi:hypothetical protein
MKKLAEIKEIAFFENFEFSFAAKFYLDNISINQFFEFF